MIKRIPVFQQAAVCLTKFGPESGETAEEILARKDLERRSAARRPEPEPTRGPSVLY
jgi:hypothetical protein